MPISHKKTTHSPLQHPCAKLAALWGTSILLNLKGHKQLYNTIFSYTCNGDILRTIGLGHLEDIEISTKKFLKLISRQQEKFAQSKPKICPKYKKNLNYFCKLIGLSRTEKKILNFVITEMALRNKTVADEGEHIYINYGAQGADRWTAGINCDSGFCSELSYGHGYSSYTSNQLIKVSEIPLPPALWLFSSALLGCISLKQN